MCIAGGGMAIIGAMIQGIGAVMSLKQQEKQHKLQAQAAENQAKQERMAGTVKAKAATRQALRIGGQQRAAFGEGGLGLTGSAVEVQEDTASEADLDIRTVQWNAQSAADNRMFTAKIERSNASAARSAMPFAFLSPILGAAANMSTSFGSYA